MEEVTSRRRGLSLHNTQYSHKRNNHDSGGIRNRNSSNRLNEYLRLRPHGYRDQRINFNVLKNTIFRYYIRVFKARSYHYRVYHRRECAATSLPQVCSGLRTLNSIGASARKVTAEYSDRSWLFYSKSRRRPIIRITYYIQDPPHSKQYPSPVEGNRFSLREPHKTRKDTEWKNAELLSVKTVVHMVTKGRKYS
jgi:hypothetical protein